MSDAERLRRAIELLDELVAGGFLAIDYEMKAREIVEG